jgi:transcriptional regulator with XRE-family HTH domain
VSIGTNIKNIRKNNNFTQEKFAEYLYCSVQSLSKWERDIIVPSLEVIKLISNTFNVPMYCVLSDDEDDFENSILETSFSLLMENHIPSLEKVASRISFSKYFLYSHFRNNEDLLIFIIKDIDKPIRNRLIKEIDNNNIISSFIEKCLPIIQNKSDILLPMYRDKIASGILIQYLRANYYAIIKNITHDELEAKIIVSSCIEIINASLTYYYKYSIYDIKNKWLDIERNYF